MTDLEYEVIKSLQQHEVITKNVENQLDQNWTLGERLADKMRHLAVVGLFSCALRLS